MPLFQTWGYIMQPTDEDLEDLILLFNDLMLCLKSKSASSDRLSQSQVKGAGVMTVSWWKMWNGETVKPTLLLRELFQ